MSNNNDIQANAKELDRLQTQVKPLLAASVYNRASTHQIMLSSNAEIGGSVISFVAVKGVETWAIYYIYGQRSDHYIASNGNKATAAQAKKWIDVEGDLIEKYRN